MYPNVYSRTIKCPSTDKWIKKMWFIHTMEYYLGVRNNEIMPFAAMWMEVEGIMLSEISHTKTDTICFHSYVDPEKLTRRPGGWGREKERLEREGAKR